MQNETAEEKIPVVWSLWWSQALIETHSICAQLPLPSEGRLRQSGCSPLHPSACFSPARQWLEASCHVTPAQRMAERCLFPLQAMCLPARSWAVGLLFSACQDCHLLQPSRETTFNQCACRQCHFILVYSPHSNPVSTSLLFFSFLSSFPWHAQWAFSNRPPQKSPWGTIILTSPVKEIKPI